MSSLVATFLVIGIAGSIFVVSFSEQIKGVVLDVLIKATSNDTVPPAPLTEEPAEEPQPQTTSTTPKWIPPGFRGPSGKPQIIGPGGNPPNY